MRAAIAQPDAVLAALAQLQGVHAMTLNLDEIKARARDAADRADYATNDCMCENIYGPLAADVLALLARVAELEREIAHGRGLAEMFPEAGPE